MKKLLIIAVILASCVHKEDDTERFIRLNNEEKAKSQARMDSINLELTKLGVNEPGR